MANPIMAPNRPTVVVEQKHFCDICKNYHHSFLPCNTCNKRVPTRLEIISLNKTLKNKGKK